MVATTQDAGTHHANWYGRILIAWILLGPLIANLYGWYADTRTLPGLVALAPAQQDDARIAYSIAVTANFILGVFVWAAGVVALGFLALRESDPPG